MLRIKLSKTGKKDRPTWRVVVVERTKTGKGAVSDYIGNYNPHLKPKEFKLDVEKFDKWVKFGAQPTDAIKRLKGIFIDKTKDYQKDTKAKVYKKKRPEEKKEEKLAPSQTGGGEKKVEEAKTEETPVVEEVKEEKTEEPKEEAVEPARNASHSDAGGEKAEDQPTVDHPEDGVKDEEPVAEEKKEEEKTEEKPAEDEVSSAETTASQAE